MLKTKPKKTSKHTCSVCGSKEHTKRNHEKSVNKGTQALPEVSLELPPVALKFVVEQKPAESGDVLKKCAYPLCKNIVDDTGHGPFCSQTCMMFDARRRHNLKGAKGDDYKPEFANERLREYLTICELSHNPKMVKVDDTYLHLKRTQLPGVEGYALFIGFSVYTLVMWAKKYTDFREAMLMLKSIQKQYLQNNGLVGVYGSSTANFLLMNNHGMRDRSERTVNKSFGIVREVYEKADSYEQMTQFQDPFGELGPGADAKAAEENPDEDIL